MSAQAEFKKLCDEHFGEVPLRGIEIGTASGIWTEYVLRNMKLTLLYTIDPYRHFPGEAYEGGRPQDWHDKIKAVADKRLSKYDNLYRLFLTSAEALPVLKDDKFDFVYIDGNHNEDYIIYDIKNYYPLVRKGGIFAGHDYNLPQVKAAVDYPFRDRVNVIESERVWWVEKIF